MKRIFRINQSQTANIPLTRFFKRISVKIDREERPDIDQVYIHTVQLLTGSGGWTLNVISLPDGRPVRVVSQPYNAGLKILCSVWTRGVYPFLTGMINLRYKNSDYENNRADR